MNDECIFCRIVKGEIPADILYQDELVTSFRDINPQAPVHALIIPNRHAANLGAMGAADAETLGRIVDVIKQVAAAEGIAQTGYRVLVNAGPDAHQEVMHTHFHLFGGRALGPMLTT